MHNVEDQIDPSITGYAKPTPEFKGIPLHLVTLRSKILLSQATISEDGKRNSGDWIAASLLYLLSLKPEEARKVAFRRDEFREKALDWAENTGATSKEIVDFADELLTESEQTKVEVSSEGGADPKNA